MEECKGLNTSAGHGSSSALNVTETAEHLEAAKR